MGISDCSWSRRPCRANWQVARDLSPRFSPVKSRVLAQLGQIDADLPKQRIGVAPQGAHQRRQFPLPRTVSAKSSLYFGAWNRPLSEQVAKLSRSPDQSPTCIIRVWGTSAKGGGHD